MSTSASQPLKKRSLGGQANTATAAATARDYMVRLPIHENFILWLNYELKHALSPERAFPLYTLPNNVSKWTKEHVKIFFTAVGLSSIVGCLEEKDMDGISLLLLQREDALEERIMGIPLGLGLKFFSFVSRLRDILKIDTSKIVKQTAEQAAKIKEGKNRNLAYC